MKLGVLLRGHHFLERDRFGYELDATKNIESLTENIFRPIKEMYPDSKFGMVTYSSPIFNDLKEKLDYFEVMQIEPEGSSQLETYKKGIQFMKDNFEFDALLSTRFDLKFKKSFMDWNVDIDRRKVFFPWKEIKSAWRDHRRVGDAIHIIGRDALDAFSNGISMSQLSGRNHMHLMYYHMRAMLGDLYFIEDGYWDTNTLYSSEECFNPLYDICNRPRQEGRSPWEGRVIPELSAE